MSNAFDKKCDFIWTDDERYLYIYTNPSFFLQNQQSIIYSFYKIISNQEYIDNLFKYYVVFRTKSYIDDFYFEDIKEIYFHKDSLSIEFLDGNFIFINYLSIEQILVEKLLKTIDDSMQTTLI